MNNHETQILHRELLDQVFQATMEATENIRRRPCASMQEEFVLLSASLGGLMKVAAEIIVAEPACSPVTQQAILDDVAASLKAFVLEAQEKRVQ